MVRESKVHSGKDSNNVLVSRQKFPKLSLPVDGSDGSSIGESSSSGDSSISVNSYKGKKSRGQHEKDSKRHKGNTSKDAETKPHASDEEQTQEQNSNLPSDQVSTNIEPEIQDADKVTIRAKLDQHNCSIKFMLPWRFRFDKLKEEVDKRALIKGNEKLREDYTIQYKDRHDKLILISCDDDVQLCVNTSRELGKKCVEVVLLNKVTIRAKLDQHNCSIKFMLPRPFRFDKLKEEVDKRVLIEGNEKLREDYTIQYKDRDDELILISCDDDVELCVNTSRVLGKTCVEVVLRNKEYVCIGRFL